MTYQIALVYGTSEGQTRKVADYIIEHLEQRNCQVELHNSNNLEAKLDLSGYDGVIVGGALYGGRFPKSIYRFVRHHLNALEQIPTGVYSVGVLAALESSDGETTTDGLVQDFLDEMGWKPTLVESFAGAIPFSHYGFFKRFLMKWMIRKKTGEKIDASKDYEYTDWERVESFAERYLSRVAELRPGEGGQMPRER